MCNETLSAINLSFFLSAGFSLKLFFFHSALTRSVYNELIILSSQTEKMSFHHRKQLVCVNNDISNCSGHFDLQSRSTNWFHLLISWVSKLQELRQELQASSKQAISCLLAINQQIQNFLSPAFQLQAPTIKKHYGKLSHFHCWQKPLLGNLQIAIFKSHRLPLLL